MHLVDFNDVNICERNRVKVTQNSTEVLHEWTESNVRYQQEKTTV